VDGQEGRRGDPVSAVTDAPAFGIRAEGMVRIVVGNPVLVPVCGYGRDVVQPGLVLARVAGHCAEVGGPGRPFGDSCSGQLGYAVADQVAPSGQVRLPLRVGDVLFGP
jgi:hypothetical protein